MTSRRLQWTKDYVEHLRMVHFSLIVTCIALVVLRTSGTGTTLERARKQITTVSQIQNKLQPRWFSDQMARLSQGQHGAAEAVTFTDKGKTVRVEIDPPSPILVAVTRSSTPEIKTPEELSMRIGRVSEISWTSPNLLYQINGDKTLVGFRKLWDTLNSDLRVAMWTNGSVSDNIIVRDNGALVYAPLSVGPVDPAVNTKGDYVDHLSLSPISANEYSEIVAHTSVEYAATAYSQNYALTNYEHTLLLGIGRTFEAPLNAQLALVPDYPPLVPGTFATSFQDLDSMTSGIQGDKIDELSGWIAQQQLHQEPDSFEAFGIKFPAETTVRWGIAVVLFIQLYFVIQLRELSSYPAKDDSALEVPWIGLYHSVLSRIALGVSLLLPLGTVLTLSFAGSRLQVSKFHDLLTLKSVAVVVTAIVSIFLSGVVWVQLETLRASSDGPDTAEPAS